MPRLPDDDLASQPNSWQQRNCPSMRSYWDFNWDAYSLDASDSAILLRRVCMWTILVLRTIISVWTIFRAIITFNIPLVVIDVILALLAFFWVAWCLATIGEADGRRRVLGVMIGRSQYDLFLLACAMIHIGIMVGAILHMNVIVGRTTWLALWVLIVLTAWTATWEPQEMDSFV